MDINNKGSKASHPSMSASTEYKDSDEMGKDIGRYINYKWLSGGKDSTLYKKRTDIEKIRSYVLGNPVDKNKILGFIIKDLDASSLNLDNSFPNVIAPQLSRMKATIDTSLYKIDAEAMDVLSIEKRSNFVRNLEKKYYAKDIYKGMSEATGVDYIGSEAIPETRDELDLLIALKGKEPQELIIQTGGESVLDMEGFRNGIDNLLTTDLVNIGEAVAFCNSDEKGKINIEYVDIADFVHSDSLGRYPDHRDMYYAGRVKRFTISEFSVKFNITSSEQLKVLAQKSSNLHGNGAWSDTFTWDDYSNFIIEAIMYDFEMNVTDTYKKKKYKNGGYKVIKKESTWNLDGIENTRSEVVKDNYIVWYEGCYVPSSDAVFGHKRQDNSSRYKNSLGNPVGRYIYYNTFEQSLVERMMPFARRLWIVWLKSQQIIQNMIPDGFFIDEKSLSNMEGKSPNEMVETFFETGTIIGSLEGEDGEQNRMPITPFRQEIYSKIQGLNLEWEIQLKGLRDVVGATEGFNGQTDANSLVGLQKLSILSTNSAIKFIRDASISMFNSLSSSLVLRLQDSISKPNGRKLYGRAFGKMAVDILDEMKNMPSYDFSLSVKVLPDLEEKAKFEAELAEAVNRQSITYEDKLLIQDYSDDTDLARKYLRVKTVKRAEEQAKMQQQTMKAQSESQNAQAQAKIQSEMQMYQMKKQADLEYERQMHEMKMETLRVEYTMKTASQMDIDQYRNEGQKELDIIKQGGTETYMNSVAKNQGAELKQQEQALPPQQNAPI